MIKSKLVKALMLGLCMSALTTGAAFAQANVGETTPAYSGEAQQEEMDALYTKQKEIDQYVFVDHIREIEEKGFMVNYTGVSETYVEIGISPYTDENANYLYELLGKEDIKVVEFDESVIYQTGVMIDPGFDGSAPDGETPKEDIYTTMELTPDTAVSDSDVIDPNLEDKVYKGDDVEIQIESTTEEATEVDPELVYTTGVADSGQEVLEVKTTSAADDAA
ncbi:MAG: putative secreted protein, partial [Herbinix sp.]|nr:putative secreted protein [Herbinix sp.]